MERTTKPGLSVIVTWCNRTELALTLDKNSEILNQHDAEVVIVNCGGSEADFAEVLAGPKPRRIQPVHVDTQIFNKALAINLGASVARSDRLFFLDADVILKEDFLDAAFEVLAAQRCFTVLRVFESKPQQLPVTDQLDEMSYSISFVARNGRQATGAVMRRFREGSRNAPGLVVLNREHFLRVGGMNADLQGYGWEDRDLLFRLQFALGIEELSAGAVIHLSHGDEVRHEAWRNTAKSEQENFAVCMKNYRAGYYFGTYQDDLVVWKDKFTASEP